MTKVPRKATALLLFFLPEVSRIPQDLEKCYKEQEICLEGQASSSGFVVKAIELKRWMQTDRRWKRKTVSRLSPTMTDNPRTNSLRNSRADWLKEPKVSMATG